MLTSQVIPFMILGFALGFWTAISGGGKEMFQEMFVQAALPTILGGQLLGVALSVFALRRSVGPNWMHAIHLRRPALIPCLLAVLCYPAFGLIAGSAVYLVQSALDVVEPSQQLVASSNAQHGLWFSMLVIGIGAAVSEELFCRGFLGRGLVGRYGVFMGVLLTSLFFGGLHLNIAQGIFAVLLGCYVHLAYLATRSLWVPILLHFLNNARAIITIFFLPNLVTDAPELTWESAGGWIGLAIVVAVLVLSILPAWGLYRLRDRQDAASPVA
jgi:membrane protease YdiL (CAAX protease family)